MSKENIMFDRQTDEVFPTYNFISRFAFHISRFTAFTLAEVLITIGVIGVVASMTIPTLINSYQKQQYVAGLQKAYTTWDQISKKLQSDYSCIGNLVCTGLFDTGTTTSTLGTKLVTYFKVAKDCGVTKTGDCWPVNFNYHYDGSGSGLNYNTLNTYYKFTTLDGMSIAIHNYADDSAYNCTQSKGTGPLTSTCFAVDFDINGLKEPNRAGRDTFTFRVIKTGEVFVSGTVYDTYPYTTYCDPTIAADTSNGYCAGKIQAEGWQMNY